MLDEGDYYSVKFDSVVVGGGEEDDGISDNRG